MAILAAVLALAAFQAGPGEPSARWSFDKDLKDSGATAVGRLEFIDSPVGGRAAVFNGVDACIQVDPPAGLGAGSADFTISLWYLALDRKPAPLLSRKGWTLALVDGGSVRFSTESGSLTGPAPAAQWNHVVVSLKRGSEGDHSKLLLNGEVVASGNIPAGDLDQPAAPLHIGKALDGPKTFTGLIDEVRLYPRALDAAEAAKLTDEGIPWMRPKPHAKTPFPGKFELLPDDVVAFTGGENARVGQDLGYLETLLSIDAGGRLARYRSMAWEGDTVYEQLRPLNFGSWSDQLRRSGATVAFAQFGQIEALEGKAGVERFSAAYQALLDQFSQTTKRIVLVSPTPFGAGALRQPDLAARNDDLRHYVDAIRKLAAKNGFLFVDLSTKALSGAEITRNGLHLSAAGQWIAAKETARQLEIPGLSDLDTPNVQGAFPRESLEQLRGSIRIKNRLWSDHWRPANWAFLNGDRMEQPSSRDHQDRRIRWFPVEIQQYPALIRREEGKIGTLIQAWEKK